MAPITFITGGDGKYREALSIIPTLLRRKLDLTEIQELDPRKIVEAKLREARLHQDGDIIVEDTSLYLEAFGGKLPGPLVKWFIHGMDGCAEAYRLIERIGRFGAEGRCVVGYMSADGETIEYFEGFVRGTIVRPAQGRNGFGWDPIFQQEGYDRPYADMTLEEKCVGSHRAQAFRLLKDSLDADAVATKGAP